MNGQSRKAEAALLNSSLNKLPPEVRGILYSYLLTQPYEILISHKRFRRHFEKQGLFPEKCMYCCRDQASCKCVNFKLSDEFYYQHEQLPRLSIATAILSTCRIVYNEAAPLLYKQNSYVSIALSDPSLSKLGISSEGETFQYRSNIPTLKTQHQFHFADPTGIERFKTATDPNHNHKVESLVLTLHSARNEVHYRWGKFLGGSKTLALATHFPNLKNVMIKLRGQYELLSSVELANFCLGLTQKLQHSKALHWVHVNGLVDAGAILAFASLVQKPKSSDVDEKTAQTDVTTCWSREGWTNVTIWWGNAGDKSPYTPPFQALDLRVKRVLQCAPIRDSKVTAREVALPYVTGVGGTSGALAFM
ncbi:MAG: hypothetical protein Q9195_003961 [Heterodermia aff. obscurata]